VTPALTTVDWSTVKRPRVLDRSNGSVYDEQWGRPIDAGADWVIVTSWNEWWENTEIEPGERYGTTYLERTRAWADAFKAAPRNQGAIVLRSGA
jgi:hypothetical protein